MRYKTRMRRELKEYLEWKLSSFWEDKRAVEESMATGAGNDRYVLRKAETVADIDRVIRKLPPTERKLIRLVYWDKSHTVTGAAAALNMAAATAYRRINEILREIACEMGESGGEEKLRKNRP